MNCRLCKKSGDFGKSHIIPRSFFLQDRIDGETPLVVSSRRNFHPRRRPVGEYDSEILCKSCEKYFDQWDDYGKKLLLDEFQSFSKIRDGNTIVGYSVASYYYQKLKLFFVSLLWRAGVSKSFFFEKVKLDNHELILRDIILSKKVPGDDDYAVTICRFSGVPYILPVLMPLAIQSSYGLKYYRIYLGNYFFDIKVDVQPTPDKYSAGRIEKNKPLLIVCRDIRDCKEIAIFEKILNAPQNKNI